MKNTKNMGKTITPTTNKIGLETAREVIIRNVRALAIAAERRILADDAQSIEMSKCFLIKRNPINKPGRLITIVVIIKPITPNCEINTKPRGNPMPTPRMVIHRLNLV